MRAATVLLAAMAVLLAAGWARANPVNEPGGGFLTKKKTDSKDYYIVHQPNSDKCSVKGGKWENRPDGAVGSPYASKEYAKTALKTVPQCKGGLTDEETGGKKKKNK